MIVSRRSALVNGPDGARLLFRARSFFSFLSFFVALWKILLVLSADVVVARPVFVSRPRKRDVLSASNLLLIMFSGASFSVLRRLLTPCLERVAYVWSRLTMLRFMPERDFLKFIKFKCDLEEWVRKRHN